MDPFVLMSSYLVLVVQTELLKTESAFTSLYNKSLDEAHDILERCAMHESQSVVLLSLSVLPLKAFTAHMASEVLGVGQTRRPSNNVSIDTQQHDLPVLHFGLSPCCWGTRVSSSGSVRGRPQLTSRFQNSQFSASPRAKQNQTDRDGSDTGSGHGAGAGVGSLDGFSNLVTLCTLTRTDDKLRQVSYAVS